MADDKRPVILIANSDPVESVNLAKQVDDYFYGTYRIQTVSTKSEATKVSQFLEDPSRPNLVAALVDEQLDNDLGQDFTANAFLVPVEEGLPTQLPKDDGIQSISLPFDATFNEESIKALEFQLYKAALPLQSTVLVKGKRATRAVMTLMRFLRLNSVPYNQVEQPPPENVKVQVILQISLGVQEVLNDPNFITISTKLNLMRIAKPVDDSNDGKYQCDVAVVGGGPAGLSAAVNLVALYGKTPIIIEQFAPGGLAATATNIIANYLGFPDGIQAAELAVRWKRHADNYDIDWLPYRVTDVVHSNDSNYPFTLTVAHNNYDRDSVAILDKEVADKKVPTKQVAAKKVLLTCGINITKQGGKDEGKYAGQGVYYSVLTGDAALYVNNSKPVAIIGGGDTAGAAAIMFAQANVKSIMIIRDTLESGMMVVNSNRIKKCTSLIDVRAKMEVIAYHGNDDGYLNCLVIGPKGTKDENGPQTVKIEVAAAYVLIGAKGLDTNMLTWLKKLKVECNLDGVLTAPLSGNPPRYNMTNASGIFVAGDARAGDVRRISEAVGDGGSASLGINSDFHQKEVS